MMLSILDGAISIAEVRPKQKKVGDRVMNRFANRFGPRSIDEAIGEGDFTLLDTLRDESSSSWLEEMGATVW